MSSDADLPPKAQSALGKSVPVRLKNGDVIFLSITESQGEALGKSVWVAAATSTSGYVGDLHLWPNNVPPPPADPAGWDFYERDRGSWSASIVSVATAFQRKGVATAMYDFAAKLGFKILPSGIYGGKRSPDGCALWAANCPQAKSIMGRQPKASRFWKPQVQRVKNVATAKPEVSPVSVECYLPASDPAPTGPEQALSI